ncbi:TetR family transcriptional regulator [Propioniferax innocua]|uniref:TetR family transcriptional regulator n=1 Tax=Propioniferax innocua TaxID=1753 RepID=A0A542ZBS7_9ACTN|nr:TetR family transcriptional regulator [Propioniferax innocua]
MVGVSYWDHRKPVTRQRAVDTSEVARTAGRILDAGGLRALTVRAVAKELDVAAASLYSRLSSADDILDLALDDVLGRDATLQAALDKAPLRELLMAYFRHLVRHPWACQVIAMRAPRGPNYLRLSERMCVLLMEQGSPDPLGDAYALSNFVIGSATTAPMADQERVSAVDGEIAPAYAALHVGHCVDPEEIVSSGLDALLRGRSS